MTVKFDQMLYGGDYNPDQWLEYPEILKQDIELMVKAHVNVVSLGIFAWAKLEPEDGVYTFDWMEEIIDRLYENGISVVLATPSGARPHWLADKYPEVLRVREDRTRYIFGLRHNHCYTSPAYRKKVHDLNVKLAERFDKHPGVILWHISNEYGDDCHCPLCQQAFRDWVKEKYQTIDEVNRKWNTAFWSHDYQNFDQIESPSSIGESSIHGLYLDWKRFCSSQTTDFCAKEIEALREGGAKKPATTNMMYNYPHINYHELAEVVDIISWDNYPAWHRGPEPFTANKTGMQHDIMRTLKKQPYMLMESCPSATSWQPVSKLKRPGMLEAASLQAVAHGSESVMYFQIRKGRGGIEKLHGALIDHYGKEDDRTYQECVGVGADLIALDEVKGSNCIAQVAVIHDWENRWALEESAGPRNDGLFYKEAVEKSYYAMRKQGLNVDIIDMTQELMCYKVVVAPMLYLFRKGFAERVRAFVEQGGIFVTTYWSDVVDESDLCVLGGTPGGLMDVFGLRSTEIDALYDEDSNILCPVGQSTFDEKYTCTHFCQLMDLKGADTIMTYGEDFYAGTPAVTVNAYGKGKAYYVGADAEQKLFDDLYRQIVADSDVVLPFKQAIPAGVEVTTRQADDCEYVFIQNYNAFPIAYTPEAEGAKVLFGEVTGEMKPFTTIVLKR